MPRPFDDDIDADDPMDADVCVHGVGFDVDCEACAWDEYVSDPFNEAYERARASGWSD